MSADPRCLKICHQRSQGHLLPRGGLTQPGSPLKTADEQVGFWPLDHGRFLDQNARKGQKEGRQDHCLDVKSLTQPGRLFTEASPFAPTFSLGIMPSIEHALPFLRSEEGARAAQA